MSTTAKPNLQDVTFLVLFDGHEWVAYADNEPVASAQTPVSAIIHAEIAMRLRIKRGDA